MSATRMQVEPVHPRGRVAELRGAVQGKDSPVTPVLASAIMAYEETEEEHE